MSEWLSDNGLPYGIYLLEVTALLALFANGRWRRLKGLCVYIGLLFGLDGIVRTAALNHFGLASPQYSEFYWLTDVVLAIGAFLLTCGFFRRACARENRMWRFVRLFLVFVFVLVVIVSALTLTRHYEQIITPFMTEFSQNLYFSCLILNTLLYLMIQQFAIEDDELGLLVCGMGVQFAGEAAFLALFNVTRQTGSANFARALIPFLSPACTMGMLLTWIYAINGARKEVPVRARIRDSAGLAEAVAE